jgi:hypothetical protein
MEVFIKINSEGKELCASPFPDKLCRADKKNPAAAGLY